MDEVTETNGTDRLWSPLLSENVTPAKRDVLPQAAAKHPPISFNLQALPSENDFSKIELDDNLKFVRNHLSLKKERYGGARHYSFLIRLVKRITRKIQGKASVEILRVLNTCQSDTSTFLWGWINPPMAGDEIYGSSIPINGWIIGRTSQPHVIQIVVNQAVIAETSISIPRPDVVKAYFTNQINCGYNLLLDVEEFFGETELILQAVFKGCETAVVGRIQFYRYR